MPLFHRRVGRNTFFFVLDKIRNCLNGWDARKLSFAGRLTLVKSVLLLIPNYFMTTAQIPIMICKEIEKVVRTFLWGSNNERKKVALVSWSDVCRAVDKGGLGIRRLYDQNMLFLLKLGFNLVTNTNSLWVRILRNKYNIHGIIPKDLHRSNCSYKGIIWIIHDGGMVNFWNDVWLHDLGPLKFHFNGSSTLDETIRVCDVINAEGEWNSTWLLTVLPREVVNRIQTCNPPLRELGADHLSWKWVAAEKFSMRESYKHLCCPISSSQLGDDEVIWKMKIPQRVRTFLWMLVWNKIFPNEERAQKCGKSIESAIHAVRDCDFAQLVWKSLLPRNAWNVFFNFHIGEWIHWNIMNKGCLTLMLTWFIWKNCNAFIFKNASSNIMNLLHRLLLGQSLVGIVPRWDETGLVEGFASISNIAEVRLIYEWCNKDWKEKFRHVLQGSNKVADCLAKAAIGKLNQVVLFSVPP
ncbi:hypothetical protein V6Z12_D10G255900 [Gossypium hirsutum]